MLLTSTGSGAAGVVRRDPIVGWKRVDGQHWRIYGHPRLINNASSNRHWGSHYHLASSS